MASYKSVAFSVVEDLIVDGDGVVPAHTVRQALEQQGIEVEDIGPLAELIGFRVVDGFVML